MDNYKEDLIFLHKIVGLTITAFVILSFIYQEEPTWHPEKLIFFIKKQYSAAQKVKKVQYWIFEA